MGGGGGGGGGLQDQMFLRYKIYGSYGYSLTGLRPIYKMFFKFCLLVFK